MKPSKEELEKKIWYRILKVLWITSTIFVIACSCFFSLSGKPRIVDDIGIYCDSGSFYSAKETKTLFSTTGNYVWEISRINSLCNYGSVNSVGPVFKEKREFTTKIIESHLVGGWKGVIGEFVLFISIGFIILFAIKKTFFYVLYGNSK